MAQKMLQSNFSRSDKNQNQSKLLPHVQAPQMTNDKSRSSLSIRLKQQVDPPEAASKRSSTRPQPIPSGSRSSTCQNQPQSLPHVQAPQMTNDKSRSSLSIRLKQQAAPAEAASKRSSTRPQPIPSGSRNSKPVTSPVEAKKVPTNIDLSAIINYTHR